MSPPDPSAPVSVFAAVNTNAPGYDLVLLAHVLAAIVGLVAVLVAGGFALALRSALVTGGPVPEAVRRYYRPGVNWAGRVLFLVPVFGVVLLFMSGGEWSFADTWVSFGTAGWALVAVAAEAVLWPGERRLQEVVAGREGAAPGVGRPEPEHPVTPGDGGSGTGVDPAALCLRSGALAIALGGVLVAVAVVMAAKP